MTGRSAQEAGASQAPPPSACPAGLGKRPLVLPWVRYWARCFAELCAFSSHNSAKHKESSAWHGCRNQVKVNGGHEGDLAATSVTPSIAKVDWADLAGWAVSPTPSPLHTRPSRNCKLCAPSKTMTSPRGETVFSQRVRGTALPCEASQQAPKGTSLLILQVSDN